MWWIALIVVAVMIPELVSTILDSRLGRAMAKRLESGGNGADDRGVSERVHFLEGEVDRLSDEVHRLRQESDFLEKLLTERTSDPPSDSQLGSGEPDD